MSVLLSRTIAENPADVVPSPFTGQPAPPKDLGSLTEELAACYAAQRIARDDLERLAGLEESILSDLRAVLANDTGAMTSALATAQQMLAATDDVIDEGVVL